MNADFDVKDRDGMTCLHYLCLADTDGTWGEHFFMHLKQRSKIIDINCATKGGTTPLMLACTAYNKKLIILLLERWANPLLKD